MKSPKPPLKKEQSLLLKKKSRRTKDEKEDEESKRIRQICAEWARNALVLASSESLKAFRALGTPDSLGRDPLGRNKAIDLLAEMAENLVPKLVVIKSKTGPKPRHAHNQTDDDIATLWSCIRMILELPGRTDIPSIIVTTMNVLRLARDYLEKHLLLTDGEANLVRVHLMSWIRSSGNPPGADESWRTPDTLQEVDPRLGLRQWASAKVPSDALGGDQVAHSKSAESTERSRRLDAALVKLVRLMALHKAPLLKADRVVFCGDPDDEERCHLKFQEFKSVRDLKLQKKEILWSAVGRLAHLQTLLRETQFTWKPDDVEYLMLEIESEITPFRRARSTPGINLIIGGLGVVKRIIVSASLRQGISPFTRVLPELDRPFPPPALPGQLSTGLGDGFVSGDGHVDSKTAPVGRKKRRKPRDK